MTCQLAQQLHAEGLSPQKVAAALAESGLDAEAVSVLINALPDARMPQALPEANLDVGVNPLAPGLFSLFELGLSGAPRTIGTYWLAFGAVLGVVVGLFVLVTALSDPNEGSEASVFASEYVLLRVGFSLAVAAIARGAYLWVTAVRIRRK